MNRPAAFLDRDGTLVEDGGYLTSIAGIRVLPGAIEAVRRLCEANIPAVIVTNQACVAKGLITEQGLAEIHAEISRLFARGGAHFSGIYYCPHHPREGNAPYLLDCDCRKPKPGLILRAAREMGLDPGRSVMIGDHPRDAVAGLAAGCRAAWIGKEPPPELPAEASRHASVLEAVDAWLGTSAAR